jgi:hypothetical protein
MNPQITPGAQAIAVRPTRLPQRDFRAAGTFKLQH